MYTAKFCIKFFLKELFYYPASPKEQPTSSNKRKRKLANYKRRNESQVKKIKRKYKRVRYLNIFVFTV